MKNVFKYALIALVLALPVVSLAAEFRSGDSPSIGGNETIANDVYMAGGNVTSAGSVNGDLFIAGGNVAVSGNITADIFVGGSNVSILSNIGDDLRVIGGTAMITGKVGGDLLVGGGQVTISGSGVGKDAIIGGGNIRLDAPVAGNVLIGGGNVYINSAIGGNVKIEAEKITLGKNAVISGNLTYKSNNEIIKEEGAIVKGAVDFKLREKKAVSPKVLLGVLSAFLLWKFLTLLACALVVGLSLRRYSKEMVALAKKSPWLELGRGLMVLILMPIVSILLFATVIGIPFGVLGLLGYVILMMFAWIIAPIILGSIVYGYLFKKESVISWTSILLGTVIYTLLGIIPFIGCLIQFLLVLISLGVIIAIKYRVVKEWK